jgi:DNA invertase Pin-like site-specific DNA recombinase
MKACIYLRLSDKDQSSYSLDNQKRGCEEYCQRYGLEIMGAFEDNGQSSYTFDRADFKRLEAYIVKNRPQFIIVYHLDRFSRNLAEALLKIRELLTKYNVKVRDISEPPDIDDNDPNTFLMRSFRFMMAENELHRIRKRTRDGMYQGALSGRYLGPAPYGYKNARDEAKKPIVIIDPDKARVVQMIYKEFIGGSTIAQVGAMARKMGFNHKGRSAIQDILDNPIYHGKVKLPGTGKLVQGIHTPIITEYDWLQAQQLRSGKKTMTRQNKEEVFLRGVLKDFQGNLMTAGNSKSSTGRYYWYYVSLKNKQNFSAKKLHEQFFKLLEALSLSQEEADWVKEKVTAVINEQIKIQEHTIAGISKKLKNVEMRITDVEEKYLLSDVSPATYKTTMARLQKEQMALQLDLISAGRPKADMIDKMNEILPAISNLRTTFEKLPILKQQRFINAAFDRSLMYYNECYRTIFLHPMFSSKAALLKENRLLVIEQPVVKLGLSPLSTGEQTSIELIDEFLAIFVA